MPTAVGGRIQGSEAKVQDLGCRVWGLGLGLRVQEFTLPTAGGGKVHGAEFKVQGLGFKVQG